MSQYIRTKPQSYSFAISLVFSAKYRRPVFGSAVDKELKVVCLEIEAQYQIKFLEIGKDDDHVHFLVQSVPTYSVTKLVTMIKSLTAREIFKRCPHVKKQLWGGEFWTDGYFASAVGKHGDEQMIANYVKNRGKEYKNIRSHHQFSML